MKTNRNEYLGQQVSTLEFVLVISGNFEFDEVIEACSNKQKYLYNQICINGSDEKKLCFSRVLDRLNQDIKDDPDEIQFPASHSICVKTSKRDDEHWKYTVGDLIDWVSVKYDLTGYSLVDWFKEEIKKKSIVNTSNDREHEHNNEFIELTTLPKFIQLAINLHSAVDWNGDTSENYLTPIFLKEVEKYNFPKEQIPKLKTSTHGKNSLVWPTLLHDERTLSQPIFKSILKMIKPIKPIKPIK
jgi:hypothetical protein